MANITNELEKIKNAVYGNEVRQSIHDGINSINEEVKSTTSRQVDLESTFDQLVINAGNSNAEIVDARVEVGGTSYAKLGDRLNKFDEQFNTITNKSTRIINILEFGAKSETGYDNSLSIQNALNSLSEGDTLVIPCGEFEYNSELVLSKSNVKLDFYGTLKYLGLSNGFTISSANVIMNNFKIKRNFSPTGTIANNLLGTGLRFFNARKVKLYNPEVHGFESAYFFDTSNNGSVAYVEMYSPKVALCKIGFNRPRFSNSTGWANEVTVFGGAFELLTYSDLEGTRCINIEEGDGFKFIGTALEYHNYERRIYCTGNSNMFIACRFEGTNGVCDIELTEKSRNNHFIGCDRLFWQTKIKDDGLWNEFNNPNVRKISSSDRTIYVDYENGNDLNMGYSESTAIKTLSRLRDILPQHLNHNYNVIIKNSQNLDALYLYNIRGEGTLTITGDISNPKNCSVAYCALKNIHLQSEVKIAGINSRGHNSLNTYYANFYFEDVNVDASYLDTTHQSSGGVCAGYNAKVYLKNSTISNKNEAIKTYKVGGCIISYNNYGENNVVVFQADGGIIYVSKQVQPAGTTEYKCITGGIVSYGGVIGK